MAEKTTGKKERLDPWSFVGHVSTLMEHDRGVRRKLLASVNKRVGMDIECFSAVEPYMDGEPWQSEHVRKCCYMVAALMTMAPNGKQGDMGTHLGVLAKYGSAEEVEKNLVVLLNYRVLYLDEVFPRLCSIVKRLNAARIAVNFAKLLEDLIAWRWSSPVRSWGLSFYRARFRKKPVNSP